MALPPKAREEKPLEERETTCSILPSNQSIPGFTGGTSTLSIALARFLKISWHTTKMCWYRVSLVTNLPPYLHLLTTLEDIWFHRYENGRDIEGRFDYNSWIESDKGRRLAASLNKDVILAEGYKEYDTGRTYLARMGDWRNNKDEEIELDGIGGVNILVKADVHRSGKFTFYFAYLLS